MNILDKYNVEEDKFLYKSGERLYKYICAWVCFVLLCAVLPMQAEAAKVVRVGWYEDAYNITGRDGERSGYGYEYQQAVATYTGWKYEYVKGSWSDLLKMLKNGEIDLMSGISYTPERAQQVLFSELPMGEERYLLYADLVNSDISMSKLDTLNGKRIALLQGSIQATQFFKWEKEHNLHMEHVFVSGFEDAKKVLENHGVDGVISTETQLLADEGLSAVETVGGSGIYFAINKQRPDLKDELDTAMRQLQHDKPFYADELYGRYLSSVSSTVLSREEKMWLTQHGVIRVGWVDHDSGISFWDSANARVAGVITDYIGFATDCFGRKSLNFELVRFDSQAEQLQALKDKRIDMIFHFTHNPYYGEQSGFSLSNTVLTMNMAAVTAKNQFVENMENTVAIEDGNILAKGYIAYNYPKWKIKQYPSFAEVEQAVRGGAADCFIADSSQLTRYLEDKKYRCVFLSRMGMATFAVGSGDLQLLSILNKTLKAMPPSMLTGALAMYDNSLRTITFMDFVKANLLLVALIFITIFTVILVIVLRLLQKSMAAEAKAKQAASESLELNKKLQASQKDLQVALQRAESANIAKTNFLFNMSHDIRTPMNALLGYGKMIKEGLKDQRLLHYQEQMEHSGNLLLSIIDNVLDMARIESGKMEVDENYFRTGKMLSELCSVFEVEAAKKNIKLVHETHVEHYHLLFDVTKVKEIFSNLLSNAIKYTPDGGTISLVTQELPCSRPGYACLRTVVTDTGIGMSKEFLPKLFDTFSRERNTTLGKVAGTGLGMAIVKKLVDMMGGTIEVESELGKGSKFSVTMEHRIADEAYYEKQLDAANKSGSKELLQGRKILLAEDNDLNAEIAVFMLGSLGLTVERVEDGVQCVAKIEKHPAGTYDLILMDIQMPNMDGYKATRAIRQLADRQKAAIPIVAMTANAFEEDRQNALAAGMNGHIAKPVDVAKLQQVLLEILR